MVTGVRLFSPASLADMSTIDGIESTGRGDGRGTGEGDGGGRRTGPKDIGTIRLVSPHPPSNSTRSIRSSLSDEAGRPTISKVRGIFSRSPLRSRQSSSSFPSEDRERSLFVCFKRIGGQVCSHRVTHRQRHIDQRRGRERKPLAFVQLFVVVVVVQNEICRRDGPLRTQSEKKWKAFSPVCPFHHIRRIHRVENSERFVIFRWSIGDVRTSCFPQGDVGQSLRIEQLTNDRRELRMRDNAQQTGTENFSPLPFVDQVGKR